MPTTTSNQRMFRCIVTSMIGMNLVGLTLFVSVPAAFALGAIFGIVAGAMLENWGTLFMGLFLGLLSPVAIFVGLLMLDEMRPAFGL